MAVHFNKWVQRHHRSLVVVWPAATKYRFIALETGGHFFCMLCKRLKPVTGICIVGTKQRKKDHFLAACAYIHWKAQMLRAIFAVECQKCNLCEFSMAIAWYFGRKSYRFVAAVFYQSLLGCILYRFFLFFTLQLARSYCSSSSKTISITIVCSVIIGLSNCAFPAFKPRFLGKCTSQFFPLSMIY